ncbi:MAG TPA: protease pro-enzyme activation domain-containing protein, partial [Rhodanobacter sp.]
AQPSTDRLALRSDTREAPRVTQTVNNAASTVLRNSHLAFVDTLKPTAAMADDMPMRHLQLMLRRSTMREAALQGLIADQHNPASPRFHQWLTPQQFGRLFGAANSDIAAAQAWLTSQGFTVNAVYPNRVQIDFSGTAGLVKHAFGTQENRYTLSDGSSHMANASDISVPTALREVVGGVAGLSSFQPSPLHGNTTLAQWNTSTRSFALQPAKGAPKNLAISMPNAGNQSGVTRALVPNDLVTMYGVRTLRNNGVVGSGVTIALIESGAFDASSWNNFTSVFNLARYGGSLNQVQPSGPSTCTAPASDGSENQGALQDAEWATAIAPGAIIVVASCAVDLGNPYGGVLPAATNLINGDSRPNIISVNYVLGELFTTDSDKAALDTMWAQADVEGISVFVPTGNNGTSAGDDIDSAIIDRPGVLANAVATSPNVTAVGGSDLADVLDGTTSTYFTPTPSVVGGSALSYVPEIPWNESCGNGVAAKHFGYNRVVGYCNDILRGNVAQVPSPRIEVGGGAPSTINAKPAWQGQVYNAEADQFRDVPDVALFAGSYGSNTSVAVCSSAFPCSAGFSSSIQLASGTSLSSAMFAAVQGLIDQGLAARGLPVNQGNAAPTLYALAAAEYGAAAGTPPASLAACNADNGTSGTTNCVFHNITRGSISSECTVHRGGNGGGNNCYFYHFSHDDPAGSGTVLSGLTTADIRPTGYGVDNKAYGARPGWSFAAGLGSVNVTNLLIAWRAFVDAPAAPAPPQQAVPLD